MSGMLPPPVGPDLNVWARQVSAYLARIAGTVNAPTYADNAAAVAGGLSVGQMYKTAAGELRVVV